MRCLYRERRYVCGDYLEVNIFPVYRTAGARRRKAKPTSEIQARLNEINAEQRLIRILHANFTNHDIELHLTYRDENLPETREQAMKDAQNFMRRVKRARAKLELPELKYVIVAEGGINGTRFHFHVTMSGGMDRSEIERLWGYGYANTKQLQFTENGIEGLARYITKQFRTHKDELPFRKRWTGSRNLIIPEPQDRDGRLPQKKVKELATIESESREPFEKLYQGYYLAECKPFYNEVNGGYYLHIKLYRHDAEFLNIRKRRRINTQCQ